MSDNASDDEPTMEEILASIRRIISDDTDDDAAVSLAEDSGEEMEEGITEPEPVAEPEVFAEPDPEPEPEPLPEPEPIAEPDAEPEPEPDPEPDPLPEPVYEEPAPVEEFFEPEPEEDDVLELTDYMSPSQIQPIVSAPVENVAAESFSHLTSMMVAGYDGADNTLEALVRQMLKPMLQGWLDENLPTIVEDAVEREVARIARRK